MKTSNESSNKPEAKPVEGHSYDGIQELDNSLPSWWLGLFYITIVFAAGYFFYYEIAGGPTLVKEYEEDRIAQETLAFSKPTQEQTANEDQLKILVKESTRVSAGRSIFQAKCVSCHGKEAQGGIGPNLTDDYWLHGGKLTDIVRTVTSGVLDKGMPPWGGALKQDEIYSVVAFIRAQHGSKPIGAKGPQGQLVEE